jgi:hypothetical protein
MVMYVRGLEHVGITEEKLASKGQFLDLVSDFERATMTLRGPGNARRLNAELHGVVDTMIDVGF